MEKSDEMMELYLTLAVITELQLYPDIFEFKVILARFEGAEKDEKKWDEERNELVADKINPENEESAAELHVPFLTKFPQDADVPPEEAVRFRPYYEQHFRCLGTAAFENLYEKFQVEKQALATLAADDEIVPFSQRPSVGTWLGWKVAPISDLGTAVTSPVNSINRCEVFEGDLGAAVTSPLTRIQASAAALYVSFLTKFLQEADVPPEEAVRFRPYYEQHFRCLGTAAFENLYEKFQVEKQALATLAADEEIVPFSQRPSVGTWLGWKVAPISDLGAAVTSPVNSINQCEVFEGDLGAAVTSPASAAELHVPFLTKFPQDAKKKRRNKGKKAFKMVVGMSDAQISRAKA